MKSFSHPEHVLEIQKRLAALEPNAARRWGKMNAHQAVVHLTDSFKGVTGARNITPPPMPKFLIPLLKWAALYSGLTWTRGVATARENDQQKEGTPPKDFAADKAELLEWIGKVSSGKVQYIDHPLMGRMSGEEWLRWGYLHCDHHLRQFGV